LQAHFNICSSHKLRAFGFEMRFRESEALDLMGRYLEGVCRICRREGAKLFLKGERCYLSKCAFERRPYPPGQHGQRRKTKISDYGTQLREKQKLRQIYRLSEQQFHHLFEDAFRSKGVTGEALLVLLERRLDNVVFRLGMTTSRTQARLLVGQRHFLVNGRSVNIPSFRVKEGDVISLHSKSRQNPFVLHALSLGRGVPGWLQLDQEAPAGKVVTLPTRQEIDTEVTEQLVVEYYSR
jgi:small subunit ribosomal protein S4